MRFAPAVLLVGLALSCAGCAELDRPFSPTLPTQSARRIAADRSAGQAPAPDSARRQYYDQRRQRYYFYDPARRAYYWESGEPKN